MNTAERIIERWGKLRGERSNFEGQWQEIAEYTRPLRNEFVAQRSPGEKRAQKVFDSTPLGAVDNFAGGIYGMMTNPANRWFSLAIEDDDLNEYDPVRDWLYEVESRLLRSFGPQISRFYSVIPAIYADLACFGTAVFYSEEEEGKRRINDSARSLSECCIVENAQGEVDTVYRRYTMQARNALKAFDGNVSEGTKKKAEKDPFCPVWFIHCVEPNGDYEPKKIGPDGMAFSSIYVEEEAKREVSRSGYQELPYQVPRWSQASGETYGRGLGELAIADVKTLNRMSETSLRAAQKAADPPLAAPDEGVIKVARTYPGGISYGAVDAQGRLLLQAIHSGADHGLTLELMEQRRNAIREAFYFSLMQMIGSPDMTATEWLGRQEEKLRLMGPNLGRIQSEFLSPLIKRRFGILLRAGQLPPAPQEIQGAGLNVEYVSPLARAQMAGEANAVVRLYSSVMPIAQLEPSVMDNLDHDEAVQAMAKGFAVPAKVLRGSAERDQAREQRAQMQQAAAMVQGAQGVAKAAKDGASAVKTVADAQQGQAA